MRPISLCMAVLISLSFGIAWASNEASNNVLDKRFLFYGGVIFHTADGEFSSTKEGRPDIEIDLDDLDLKENSTTYSLGAIIKFGKKLKLRLDYFGYHDDAENEAEFGFEFEDVAVPVGARIDSNLDLDVYVVNLSYDIIHRERLRFGVGIGAHLADIDLEVSAKLMIGGDEISLGEGNEDLLAPLPNLYASGAYGFSDTFIFRYGGGWMSLNYKDYDGRLLFAQAFLEYWPFRSAGFGVGYRYVHVDVDYDPGNKKETYDVTLPGPTFYLTVGF